MQGQPVTPLTIIASWFRRNDRPSERWLRLTLNVDSSWLDQVAEQPEGSLTPQQRCESAVLKELSHMGFPARVAYQDPTAPEQWQAVACHREDMPAQKSAHVSVRDATPIEEPVDPTPANDPLLDEGISTDEAEAVRLALLKDHDPKRLNGFAESMSVELPIAHALLAEKASRMREARIYRASGRPLQRPSDLSVSSPGTFLTMMPLPEEQVDEYRYALSHLASGDPIETLATSANVLRAALASFSEDGRTLDPAAVRHFSAAKPKAAPPSSSALQLAFASLRPQTSGVRDPGNIRSRTHQVRSAAAQGDLDAQKAADQIDKATRAIERSNWVLWYGRASRAGCI